MFTHGFGGFTSAIEISSEKYRVLPLRSMMVYVSYHDRIGISGNITTP